MTAIALQRDNFRTFRIARVAPNKANVERLDRTRDVLDALFAKIVEAVWQLATDLVAYGMRHAYATNRRQRLKSIRNVHSISVNVLWLDNNFGDIDADPENEAGRMRHPGVPQRHALLNIDGTLDRIYHAGELDEHAVSNGLDDMPAGTIRSRLSRGRDARTSRFGSLLKPFTRYLGSA
jgi:hypothetical protein